MKRGTRIVFIPGDANGIGPELTAKFFAEPPQNGACAILLGDEPSVFLGCKQAGVNLNLHPVAPDLSDIEKTPAGAVPYVRREGGHGINVGHAAADSGRAALGDLDAAVRCVVDGHADGVCFAPLNKEAMIAGGMRAEDELTYLADALQYKGPFSEINILQNTVWTSRVTSHVPLRRVPGLITGEKIICAARLINSALRESGREAPRLAVAALNPHAGDGGNFGREEIDVIAPAVRAARAENMSIDGPFPADTIFVRAFAGEFDGVVTMYHDQGQIAIKLMGFERGVSLLGGLPVPIATPAHGTAFDIAGRGRANVGATRNAFAVVSKIAAYRRRAA